MGKSESDERRQILVIVRYHHLPNTDKKDSDILRYNFSGEYTYRQIRDITARSLAIHPQLLTADISDLDRICEEEFVVFHRNLGY